MLLIDGVKYELIIPKKEDEEFVPLVLEHTNEIFGTNTIYINTKKKLHSNAGIVSIPDGYVLDFNHNSWHIVEFELSNHALYDHIVPQVTKFNNGIKNHSTQRDVINFLYAELTTDELTKLKIQRLVEPTDLHKYISDLISKQPFITVIIEKLTPDLLEALDSIPLNSNTIEFKTYLRSDANNLSIHAHIFDTIYPANIKSTTLSTNVPESNKPHIAKRVSFQELRDANLIGNGQTVYFHHIRPFKDEKAKILMKENKLLYLADGNQYSVSELAKMLLTKHHFKHDEHGVQGPIYWHIDDDSTLHDLNQTIRQKRGY